MDPIDKIDVPTVSSLGKLTTRGIDEETALRAFDAYFIGEMLRQSAPKESSGLFDGGQAGRMYQDHWYQEMAKLIAEKGDFGLAGALKGSLTREDKVEKAEDKADDKPQQAQQPQRKADEEGS